MAEFLAMSYDDFLQIRGLGKTKLVHIEVLRALFLQTSPALRAGHIVEEYVPHETDGLVISKLALPHQYKAICNLLVGHFGESVTVGDIRQLDANALKAIPMLGKKKVTLISEMIAYVDEKMLNEFSGQSLGEAAPSHLLFSHNEDIDLSVLQEILIQDLASFFSALSERDQFITSGRLGYLSAEKTLQEIGDTLPSGKITRERVRQLQQRIERNWHAHMRISPTTLWVNVKSNLSLLRAELFTELQSRFSSKKGFYEFLEMSCNLSSGGLTKIVYPEISPTILDDFWAINASPAELETITLYLQDRLGIEKAVAENAISHLDGKKVELLGEMVIPINLSKPLALANTLLDYPKGLAWNILHKKVNEKAISRARLPEERIDGSISAAVDNGWAYQIDRGAYRHLNFLQLTEDEIEQTLQNVREVLVEEAELGRNSLNLSIDYYQKGQSNALDYFTVRHIVRAFGERQGIFFNGKSGTDTISIEQDFSLASQENVLVALFAASNRPLDKKFIASKIRSQSLGHAGYYLDKLLLKGTIVRVDEADYQLTEYAFAGLDVEAIIHKAAEIIESESRAIEVERIQRHINNAFDFNYNKYLYMSLLKSCAADFGFKWHFVYNLVCKTEFAYESLSDMCRQLLSGNESYEDAIAIINQHCLIDPGRVRNMIKQIIQNEKAHE